MRRDVLVVLGQTTQIGDTGNVGPLARSELHWQLLNDGFVGHGIDDDLGAGVGRFKALGNGGGDFALNAVLVAHDADIGRMHRRDCHCQSRRGQNALNENRT